jgi:purine-binding chemotaxis protein CheW
MTNSYLLFQLSGGLFGVRLVGAIEILPWRACRAVPLSYSYVEGILDYRGSFYPVYSLVHRLGLAKPGPTGLTAEQQEAANREKSIILLEENKLPFGIIVDSVLKMTKLEEQSVPRETVKVIDPRYVKGYVNDEDRQIIILDFERLFHVA